MTPLKWYGNHAPSELSQRFCDFSYLFEMSLGHCTIYKVARTAYTLFYRISDAKVVVVPIGDREAQLQVKENMLKYHDQTLLDLSKPVQQLDQRTQTIFLSLIINDKENQINAPLRQS
ncbi:MAG: hypothetical protein K0U13_01355 [Chlamydiae bacterium]|nr:hypothetical protein [Chlamydiota bacterium]